MNPADPIQVGFVLEGPSDRRTVCGLVDRLMREKIGWINDNAEHINAIRRWLGVEEADDYLKWSRVRELAARRGVRRHGHFAGEPGSDDAHTASLALRLFALSTTIPLGVVLVRDSDGRSAERLRGLTQARADGEWPFCIVLGVAHNKREAWVLAGFIVDKQVPEEATRLEEERQTLGFYPDREPHRLDAQNDTAPRSAKRVLKKLSGANHEREARCWMDAPLDTLTTNGSATGLPEFLQEVEARLVPALR